MFNPNLQSDNVRNFQVHIPKDKVARGSLKGKVAHLLSDGRTTVYLRPDKGVKYNMNIIDQYEHRLKFQSKCQRRGGR